LITHAQFQQFAADAHTPGACNLVPVVREVLSDLDTPLSVYLKLADGPHTYLFESVEGGERFGRYSIIGLPARRVYEFRGHTLEVREYGEVVETREVADPLAEVERCEPRTRCRNSMACPALPAAWSAGSASSASSTSSRACARNAKPDELGTPDILLMLSDELAVFDNLKGRLYLIVHADPRSRRPGRAPTAGSTRSATGCATAARPIRKPWCRRRSTKSDFRSSFTREEYHAVVRKAQEYIRAGDIFQVVLSQRLSVPFTARPVDVYRALRALNPSPYMYFLDTGDPGRRFLAGNPGAPAARCTARVRSPCARSPAPARAARPSRKTRRWKPNCWPIRRNAPST
jgi:anthranilate synthase component 1